MGCMADYSDEDLKLIESVRQEERQRLSQEIGKLPFYAKIDSREDLIDRKEVLALLSEEEGK